jgi:ketosteroid isomerase-like protein
MGLEFECHREENSGERSMKIRQCIVAITLAVLTVALPAIGQNGQPQEKVAKEILALREHWLEAEETKDIPYMQQLIADECVIGNSQGQVLNKSQFLDRMRDPERILKVSNTRDLSVKQYGTVAIQTERVTIDGTDHGQPFGGEFRFVRIFAMQEGHWKVVLNQGTPIKAAPPVLK